MPSYMEHANISVTNVDGTLRFLQTSMPDFRIRHDSGLGPDRWVHVGTETAYVCLNQMTPPPTDTCECRTPGINHLGFAVDDADALHERMIKAGYREGFIPSPHPHRKRVYFIDDDGMEYEFIQYYSEDPSERNDYGS